MKKLYLILLTTIIVAFNASISLAQDGGGTDNPEACAMLVQEAYRITQNACEETGRDEACYGNIQLEASPASLAFSQTGDLVSVGDIETLRLSSMDTDKGEWGISLMRVGANFPETGSIQSVELLLFGNVSLAQNNPITQDDNDSMEAAPMIRITAGNTNINVRSIPSTNGTIIGTIESGTGIDADGRNDAGDWLRVNLAAENEPPLYGWVFMALFDTTEDVSSLAVVDSDSPTETSPGMVSSYGPMQAFYFVSGEDDRPCVEAPDSGILIQTASGEGTVDFLINEVSINLGSTAYIQAVPSGYMRIAVLEGLAKVEALGSKVNVPSGFQVLIPLDANGVAAGEPVVEAYDLSVLEMLPLSLLGVEISVAEPFNPDNDPLQLRGSQWNYFNDTLYWCGNGTGVDFSSEGVAELVGTDYGFDMVYENGASMSYLRVSDTEYTSLELSAFVTEDRVVFSMDGTATGFRRRDFSTSDRFACDDKDVAYTMEYTQID